MKLYHGTSERDLNSIRELGILINKCNLKGDFGQGFYVTPNLSFAKKCAKRKAFHDGIPVVLCFEFDEDLLNMESLHFRKPDIDWAQFIINNRAGWDYVNALGLRNHNLDGKYKIVHGRIADGNIVQLSYLLKNKNMLVTDEHIHDILNSFYPQQWSFHNQEWIDSHKEFVKFIVMREINYRR